MLMRVSQLRDRASGMRYLSGWVNQLIACKCVGMHRYSLQLASLVPPVGKSRVAVLALGVDVDLAAESLRDAGEVLDWGGSKG